MKISIKECLARYAAGLQKEWQHDRLNTVGASEIGQCLRKTWFAKHEAPQDEGYEETKGAALRGNMIEQHYWVPGLRAALPEGVELLYAGDDQRTLVDGYLSATTDGLLVGVERDALTWLGVPDTGADCINLDSKSIDPRVNLTSEKAEHSFQVQTQMGLIRHATNHRPEYSILSYVDASFWNEVSEFAVQFDPKIYEAAKARARQVMTSEDPLTLPPEGKIAGGNECKYCAWASHCAHVTVAGIPKGEITLSETAVGILQNFRNIERLRAERKELAEKEHAEIRETIKEFLRVHKARRFSAEDWSISWSSVKGRETIDLKAAEAAGVDLSPFKKLGDPSERLSVK